MKMFPVNIQNERATVNAIENAHTQTHKCIY